MLVEINLLPQKEPKKIAFFIVLAVFVLALIFASVFYYFQISSTKISIESVSREISMTQKVREKQEQKSDVVESADSVSKLKSAIDWADTYPIQTIPVMRHLTSLLPDRGFIQSFGYTEAGTITLSVQFDSSREAAYFLNSLKESEWIADVNLSSLAAVEQKDENTEGTQTGTTGTDATASAAANPATQSPTSPTDTSTGGTAPSGTETNTTGSNNSSATAESGNNQVISPYLPRYNGQFEITLNKTKVKEIAQKDEKGVSGS
ncbi:PilN domain-containing protein [Bacillus sp. FJAT-29814]|uniref:PilN domain-containing protein n=1 Tax=Bacillus sp. FJAT-29814 TaxID=1729688 RepID=UPI000835593B|nr:PilN domain-containing protein [Bacillus sp. FJAT-29814]